MLRLFPLTMISASLVCLYPGTAHAQAVEPTAPTDGTVGTALPDFVPPNKRMSDAELAKKKTGAFVTALPGFSSDPLNGFGGAVQANVFYNGDRTDPFFAYTPYRAKTSIYGQYTTLNTGRLQLGLDVPYLYDSPWRMKLDLKYKNDPNRTFFGLTEATLDPLPGGTYASYSQGLKQVRPGRGPGEATEVTDTQYNLFKELEYMANAKFERSILDGNTRLMIGYELQHLSFSTYEGLASSIKDPATGQTRDVPNGQSRIGQGTADGSVKGLGGGVVSIIQTALIYDTRDFEPDPTRGVFLEAANEFSDPMVGSQFAFNKVLLQAKTFHRLWPERFEKTVFATRFGLGTILGEQAPFFEYHDQWTTEGSITALGGSQTLRGYKTNRFLGRSVAFANLELRHRFAELDLFNQNLTFAAVPFVDLGAVGDKVLQVRLDQPRAATGLGLRIGWNRSTIVAMDYAVSPEDQQFFLNFNKSY